jgi:TusA-related sulfurtransferase
MNQKIEAQIELDLRGVICPYNFVKTKLKLDTMSAGEILAVILDDGEPIRNVPQSVKNEGHTILTQDQLGSSHRVLIQKGED